MFGIGLGFIFCFGSWIFCYNHIWTLTIEFLWIWTMILLYKMYSILSLCYFCGSWILCHNKTPRFCGRRVSETFCASLHEHMVSLFPNIRQTMFGGFGSVRNAWTWDRECHVRVICQRRQPLNAVMCPRYVSRGVLTKTTHTHPHTLTSPT